MKRNEGDIAEMEREEARKEKSWKGYFVLETKGEKRKKERNKEQKQRWTKTKKNEK